MVKMMEGRDAKMKTRQENRGLDKNVYEMKNRSGQRITYNGGHGLYEICNALIKQSNCSTVEKMCDSSDRNG